MRVLHWSLRLNDNDFILDITRRPSDMNPTAPSLSICLELCAKTEDIGSLLRNKQLAR